MSSRRLSIMSHSCPGSISSKYKMAVLCVMILTLALHQDLAVATSTSTQAPAKWTCPEGWLLKINSCYRWGTSQMSHSQAKAQCQEWGSRLRVIKNDEENQLFRVSSNGNYYWLGIERSSDGWRYYDDGETHYITYGAFQTSGSQRYAQGYDRYCTLWLSSNGVWSHSSCGNPHLFICQLPADCVSGRFGANCSDECHCKGEVCNSTSGFCVQGCQLGWTGSSCNIAKLRAEAKFYCFKINSNKEMVLRVNQRGTKYRSVSALDKNDNSVGECNKIIFNHFESGGMATLKVAQHKNGKFKPECGEHKVSADVVTWKFKFQEFPMTSSAYDILFEVTCDFTKADTLHRLVTSNNEKSSNKTTTLTESRVSVSFDIVDPFNDKPVTTVKLGQQVKLQIKLNNGDDFGVTAISPYNCSVSTLDETQKVVFRDEHGCTPEDAQIRFEGSDLTKWRSDLFEAFTFQGYDKVNFQCNFHVCFEEQHDFCRNTCTHSKKRKSRKLRKRHRSKTHAREKDQGLGTTVSIQT